MGNYFKLIVWQRSKDLAVRVYKLTQGKKISKINFKELLSVFQQILLKVTSLGQTNSQ